MGKGTYSAKQLEQNFWREVKRLLEDKKEWNQFLTVSARLIHYPFTEQIQIYLNKPNATAVASRDLWVHKLEMRMGYSKIGIPLIDISQDTDNPDFALEKPIHYYWDIEDVHPLWDSMQKPPLWKFPEHTEGFAEVMDRLGMHVQEEQGREELERQLWEWVENKVHAMNVPVIPISLPDIEQYHLGREIKRYLQSIVAYQVFSRCGLDTEAEQFQKKHEELLKQNPYAVLVEGGNEKLLLALGEEATKVSRPVFKNLRETVEAYERNISASSSRIETKEQRENSQETIQGPEVQDTPVQKKDYVSEYRLLDRLRSDCDYFLGEGNRSEKELWAGSVQGQISKMRELYALIPEKPEWLSEESINSYATRMVEKSQEQSVLPSPNIQTSGTIESVEAKQKNFHISGSQASVGGAKNKFYDNLNAIRLLKELEASNRPATPEQQEILAKYVGWGGLSEAFSQKINWEAEARELQEVLTPQEYRAARSSTLNAHYTSPVIIEAMYDAVKGMGIEPKRILEPSMGIGNFFGMLPETMRRASLYGVELDSITGRIAKQLYPEAHIDVMGYEKTEFQDEFFDLAVGNVPFGNYKVLDKNYEKENFLIHDYFFAKTADKLCPGGVMAFITSTGTLDKADSSFREYLARRCDLLGAIRLPNGAFSNAGTNVNADILFLQKRQTFRTEGERLPDWIYTDTVIKNDSPIMINRYFKEHPEMALGDLKAEPGPYGIQAVWKAIDGKDLKEQLQEAILHIRKPDEAVRYEPSQELSVQEDIRCFSYFEKGRDLYFKEANTVIPVDMADATKERIRGMIRIRDLTRRLIQVQLNGKTDEAVEKLQGELNVSYDRFSEKYGLISSNPNRRAFNQDSSYCLLCSLEIVDEDGKLERKADMFSKRTIHWEAAPHYADTASEALAISIGEKAKVDLDYMSSLTGKSRDTLIEELETVIYKDPGSGNNPYVGWQTADEYLSGDVRKKLEEARKAAEINPFYKDNINALEEVQPEDLTAAEIDVEIGATWVAPKYYTEFVHTLLEIPYNWKHRIQVRYSEATGEWNIEGAVRKTDSLLLNTTYGTKRRNAYSILIDSLNLKDSRVYDVVENQNGNLSRIMNNRETVLAQQKQEQIRAAFRDWIWKDPIRRSELCKTYNTLYNSIRPRTYNGDHIRFVGMNTEITLRKHQRDAVARMLYGGNTLLAHCVGAGKTYEMIAAAMESKRLGLSKKPMMVVPNHLTEQWGADFMRLYPGANILVATKKDFEPMNRKKFCSRIVTGDYDAVIIGHSQFEKIPMSAEYQKSIIEEQIDQILEGIQTAKYEVSGDYTVKQLEKTRKSLEVRLEKLNDQSRKDDVVTFEELGVDKIFVDEAHGFKNLFLATKMRNVAGIGQTEAQKSSDMFAKCRYLDELTGGRGVVFATGTPVSNSMTELYTMMRYLQYDLLKKMNLVHFDSWASSFGKTVTALELAPEGTGFRSKTRFAKFVNLPELMSMWREATDIQTAEMLNLPVPKVLRTTEVIKPTDYQKEIVGKFAERAEAVRNRSVAPEEDNMLKITSDGRKLALDQRLFDASLPDDSKNKISICARNIIDVWRDTSEKRGTQLVFCDLSTPKGEGFNVYHCLKEKLVYQGIPEKQIVFIHDAKTEVQKAELFARVRKGQVRVLIGSTAKMGAGTNVQTRLAALHHLDCPWRPADIEQREGRILRQGNLNQEVKIFKYVTQDTFDAYNWSIIENKQKFISQLMSGKNPSRSCEDVDEATLSYAEVKALATGNPYIKEKMELDVSLSKLKMERAAYQQDLYRMEDACVIELPRKIQQMENRINEFKTDWETYQKNRPTSPEQFKMQIGSTCYTERKEAAPKLLEAVMGQKEEGEIGSYLGFQLRAGIDGDEYYLKIKGASWYKISVSENEMANLSKLTKNLNQIPELLKDMEERLRGEKAILESTKEKLKIPFPKEELYQTQLAREEQLNRLLNQEETIENYEENPVSADAEEPLENEIRGKVRDNAAVQAQEYEAEEQNRTELPVEKEIPEKEPETFSPSEDGITYKAEFTYLETTGADSGERKVLSTREYQNVIDAFIETSRDNGDILWYEEIEKDNGEKEIRPISTEQLEVVGFRKLSDQYGLDGKLTEPVVIINYSESDMFEDKEIMPLHIAEQRFAGYDAAQYEISSRAEETSKFCSYYYKTSFQIVWEENGEIQRYSGRYDIGDGDGGLINHIKRINTENLSKEFLASMASVQGQEQANEIKETTELFLHCTLPELQNWMRYSIEKGERGYHILDRFAVRETTPERIYGDLLKENNKAIRFETIEEAKEFIKSFSVEERNYHHIVQNREIAKARQTYEKTLFRNALYYHPENGDEIKKEAFRSGYLLNEAEIQKLAATEISIKMQETIYTFHYVEDGYICQSYKTGDPENIRREIIPEEGNHSLFEAVLKKLEEEHHEFRDVKLLSETQGRENTDASEFMFEYVKDGQTVSSSESLSAMVTDMLVDRAVHIGEIHTYEIYAKPKEEQQDGERVCVIKGTKEHIKASIEAVHQKIDLNNPDLKALKHDLLETLKPAEIIQVLDPYNRLGQNFEDYKSWAAENPWRYQEARYANAGVPLSPAQKEQLSMMNHYCGHYISPEEIKSLAKGEPIEVGKNQGVDEQIQKSAKQFKDTILEKYDRYNEYIERYMEEVVTTEKVDVVLG